MAPHRRRPGPGRAWGTQQSRRRRHRPAHPLLPTCWLALPAGQGGTGDTWQFRELKTGQDVAVKFIKRPLPKVLQTNILREFTVS
jgi:serine/threonine-protein kinase SRK2